MIEGVDNSAEILANLQLSQMNENAALMSSMLPPQSTVPPQTVPPVQLAYSSQPSPTIVDVPPQTQPQQQNQPQTPGGGGIQIPWWVKPSLRAGSVVTGGLALQEWHDSVKSDQVREAIEKFNGEFDLNSEQGRNNATLAAMGYVWVKNYGGYFGGPNGNVDPANIVGGNNERVAQAVMRYELEHPGTVAQYQRMDRQATAAIDRVVADAIANKGGATTAPTQPESPAQAPTKHEGYAVEVRNDEEANLVGTMISQGKSQQEIQSALDNLRANAGTSNATPGGAASHNIQPGNVGNYPTTIRWGILDVRARPEGPGFWGTRTEQSDPRVDAYEQKINPNNESYYLPHPNGGYVQFENATGSTLQDGKLIVNPTSSFYTKVNELSFAKDKVLQEARRQVEAAQPFGLKVEWLISDENTVKTLTDLFKDENINITVKHFAE